jgi:hypothetical protein
LSFLIRANKLIFLADENSLTLKGDIFVWV